MNDDEKRLKIVQFLQWNDKYGAYTDELRKIEGLEELTYEEAIRDFFGVLNEDFYYQIVDNIFELSYEEVITYAKDNHFYEETLGKLQKLLECETFNEEIYREII